MRNPYANRAELRAAKRKHKKKLLPFLMAAALLIEAYHGDELLKKLEKLDKRWREYCVQYDQNNENQFPNHEAFKRSIANHMKPLKTL